MKSPILFLAAAAVGFLGGWLAKPAPAPSSSPPPARPAAPGPAVPIPPADAALPPEATAASRSPVSRPPVAAPPLPVAPVANRDEAKFGRLAEMLGLDEEGREALKLAFEESRAAYAQEAGKALTSRETLELIAGIAGRLEDAIDSLLAEPEQKAAFAALRERERDNRIEAKVQREMGVLSSITDILPEQRELIESHFRQRAGEETSQLSPELSFAVESSVLPLGPLGLSEDALLALLNAADQDPALAKAGMFSRLARRFDEQLAYLKTVLTPAQYAQVELAAAEQRAIRERIQAGGSER